MLLKSLADRRLLFFGGKGGTGKTTLASATAIAVARQGQRVLLVSTDPAHNLAHLFDTPVGDRPVTVADRLEALELDPQMTVTEHIKQTRGFLQRLMPARLRGEIDRHLEHSRQAPGMVEAALLESLAVTIESGQDVYDLIVVDTAPSGHTARLMELPELMAAWTDGLIGSRERSHEFAAAASALGRDARIDARDERDQQIRAVLYRRRERFRQLRARLVDQQNTGFVIVLNPERLPVLETIELHAQLCDAGVPIPLLIVNKRTPRGAGDWADSLYRREEQHVQKLVGALPAVPSLDVEQCTEEIVGAAALARLADSMFDRDVRTV